jgi:hypothetical protein
MQVRPERAIPVVLAWLSLTAVAVAQDLAGQDRGVRSGRHRVGPAQVTIRLQLRNAGVDTNVFQSLVDPVRDEVVVLALQGDGVLPIGHRLVVNGSGFVEQNHYQRIGDQSATDFFGQGRAELELGAVQLFGGGSGGQFTQRFSIDVDERLTRQEKLGYAGAVLRLTRRLSFTGKASGEVLTFAPAAFRLGGDVKEAMDRNTLTASGELRQTLTPRTTLVVAGDVLEDRFFSQPPPLPNVRRSYRVLGGLELNERAKVSGRLLVGMREFPGTLAQGSPPYTGPIMTADLTLPLGRVASLRLQGLRDVLYASSLVEVGHLRYRNAFIYERALGEAFLPLFPKGPAAVLSAGFEQADYLLPYPTLSPYRLADRVDHRFTAGAGLVQRLGDRVRVGGHVLWARRVSSIPYFSYEDVRYGLNAEIVP